MRTRALIAIAIIFLLPGVLGAQDNEWFLDREIVDITFEDLENVRESDLTGVTEPFIGRTFTDSVFNDIQRRLFALDLFTDLIPEAVRPADDVGMILNFIVTERPTVSEVRFEGNRNFRATRLIDEIVLGVGDVLITSRLRSDTGALETFYQEQGYANATVEHELSDVDENNRQTVTFRIEEGARTTIDEVQFVGNTFASAGSLRRAIVTREQSIFNSGVFREGNLEEDRQAIQRWYAERGFVDAQVSETDREVIEDDDPLRTRLRITYFIEEGEQFTFDGFEFEGNVIFSDDQLLRGVRLQEGRILNAVQLQQDFDAILDVYREGGYLFNEIDLEERRDETGDSIGYTIRIVERGRARIENISVRGNERTRDHVILREVPLQEGDVFSLTRLRQGLQNLANTQFFTGVVHDIPEGSVPGLLDLVLTVEEAPTTDLTFGITFGGGGDFPVSGQIGWQDRNFRGLGQTFGLNVTASPGTQSLSLTFQERWFTGRPWSLGGDVTVTREVRPNEPQDVLSPFGVTDPFTGEYVFSEDQSSGAFDGYSAGDPFPGIPTDQQIEDLNLVTDFEYAGGRSGIPEDYLMTYEEWSVSTGANTSRRFTTPLGRLTLGTNGRIRVTFATYDDTLFRPADPILRDNLNQWRFVNSLGFNASLDNRDIIFNPSSGGLVRQELNFVGGPLGGNRHYIRTDTRAEHFFTLWDVPVSDSWNWKGVLGAHTSVGIQWPAFFRWDGDDPFAPGPDRLFIDGQTVARGWPRQTGEARWNNWIELRQPLAPQVVWFDTFLDAVALYDERADMLSTGRTDFLFTMGAGLRFTIPQFPIRLYLGKRFSYDNDGIQWEPGDVFNNPDRPDSGLQFIFSLGTEFF